MHKILLICAVLLIDFISSYTSICTKNSCSMLRLTITSDCLPVLSFQKRNCPRNSLILWAWGKCGVNTKPPYANKILACVSCDLRLWLSWSDTQKHHDIQPETFKQNLVQEHRPLLAQQRVFGMPHQIEWLGTAWSFLSAHGERRRDRTCCVRTKLSSCLGKISARLLR